MQVRKNHYMKYIVISFGDRIKMGNVKKNSKFK